MKLILSAQEPTIDGPIDRRFGRSRWLIGVETESNQWEAFENPGAAQSGGAGVAAAQFVIDQKADAVVSGDFGPHAAGAFRSGAIEMRLYNEAVATVKDAVDLMVRNELKVFK